MKRMMLFGVVALIALAGCEELKPTTLRERNQDQLDTWAETHVTRLYEVCQDQYRAGQMKEVESKCNEALRLDPDHEGFQLMLGKVQIELSKYEAAEETLQKLVEASPNRFDVHYFLGVARERQGNLKGAYDSFLRAHELSVGRGNSEYTAAVTEVLVSMGRPAEAQQFLEANMPSAGGVDARIFELAGRVAGMVGQHRKAVAHLQRACLMDPQNKRYPEMLGEAQFKAGQFAEAIGTLTPVVQRPGETSGVRLLIMLGDSHLALGQTDRAIRYYTRACRQERNRTVCWTSLAKGQLAASDVPAAIESARYALYLSPRSLDASQILAYALLRQNEVVEAARVLKRARESHPKDTTITCLLGQTYAAIGKHDQAERFYNYALTLDADCAMARDLLAAARRD